MDKYCQKCLEQVPMRKSIVYSDERECIVCGAPNPHFDPSELTEGDEDEGGEDDDGE